MSDRALRRLAKGVFGLAAVLMATSIVLRLLADRAAPSEWGSGGLSGLFYVGSFFMFPVVGLVIALRRPTNALAWVMLAIGVVMTEPSLAYGELALDRGLPGAAWAIASTSWTWVPVVGFAGTYVLLLFPDGHLPSPRWRWFAWAVGIAMAVTSLAILLGPGSLVDMGYPELENPFGIDALEPVFGAASAALLAIPLGMIGSAWSLIARYRRSGTTERLQIKWLAMAAVVVATVFAVTMAATLVATPPGGPQARTETWVVLLQDLSLLSFALLPIAIGIAVLKYRLFEIDLVIRKAVIVAALAAFFGLVYAAIVGGIGAVVSSRSTPTLSFVAAAVVALLFQPMLARARRFADHVVYGKRATPYEVLAEFSDRVAETYAADDVLSRMATVVAEGVGATRSDVWLRAGDRLRVAATHPVGDDAPTEVALRDGTLPDLPGADAAFPVEHQGELLGALAVSMPPSEPMDPAKERLVGDLAAQAGLVLRNVRLTEDLRRRLDDLRAAQKRLVAAQDQERRRIERNIHDGAQQQLVALAVKLRLVKQLIERDPAKVAEMLDELQAATQETLDDLRDLARGIYPPLLADQGLPAALEAQARKSPITVAIEPDGVGRYAPEIEAAVYFSVLEALQNVAKYANAGRVVVRLGGEPDAVRFEVEDDGVGFDPAETVHGSGLRGIGDRLGALDGEVEVRSSPGAGTRVAGRIPVGAAAPAE